MHKGSLCVDCTRRTRQNEERRRLAFRSQNQTRSTIFFFFLACFFNEVRQVVLPLSFDAGKQNRVYLEVSRCTSEPSNAIGIYLQSPEIMTYIHPPLMFSTVTCYESICERHEKREKTYYSLFLCYFGAVKSETPETKLLPATVGRIGENRNRCMLRVHLFPRTRMCSTRGSHMGVYAHHTCTTIIYIGLT